MRKFTVYLPVIHSDLFFNVWAENEEEAIRKAKSGEVEAWGTQITGLESEGDRAVESKE